MIPANVPVQLSPGLGQTWPEDFLPPKKIEKGPELILGLF